MANWRSTIGCMVLGSGLLLGGCGGGGGDGTTAGDATTGERAAAVGAQVPDATAADTQLPTLVLNTPADLAANLTGRIDITADASDNVGIAGVEFQVDGALWGDDDTNPPYMTSITTTRLTTGQHVIRARARDTSNNRSAWVTRVVQFGNDVQVPEGFTKTALVGGLTGATSFAQAPDGRIFVAQQTGEVRVIKNGVLLPTPFATLANVNTEGSERGLGGIVLHPDFATNGWVYVYYTTNDGGTHNRISRFTANGDVAAGPPTALFGLPTLTTTMHNGGAMHFGIDGKLYVGVGDGGLGAPAQDRTSLFGKMLRLNDDATIPTDNPYYGTNTGNARAVWAIGLRNPFTFAIRPSDGRIHINDVGQNTWEEIDVGIAGANYGWPNSEGPDNLTAAFTAPLFTYRHTAATPPGSAIGGFIIGRCIAGGAFYPVGGSFPARFQGNYFFADFTTHEISRVDLSNGNAVYSFAKTVGEPVDLRVATDGALLVLTRNNIVRIAPT
ncbi:PQQ-dependent sugar dehydrogenase [Rhizobacter sp. SG703]|uniref:PQQ-dependent sugar dehydrogenase n=1 Tax=Rhizobacter sp. SG703 TaxID=2587140 RepID=UPI0014472C9B|nr:PQQ-dependent sugar dehydrogenase [Rhizobacter sp. SG703]NKI93560.1 glucose/arabinose dehydrogenase [Rhizobacter sp. SG703]